MRSYLAPVVPKPTRGRVDLVNRFTNTIETDPVVVRAHDLIRAHVLGGAFACALGMTALAKGRYRVGVYASMTDLGSADGLCEDLWEFIREQPSIKAEALRAGDAEGYSTFLAIFHDPIPADELEYETNLWRLLQNLHEKNKHHHGWDPAVKSDPHDPDFSFSVGGSSFFVVGLHGVSSRLSRKTALPAIAFNSHHQFEDLRANNKFTHFQTIIRRNDVRIQGAINPSLSNYGSDSEAKQYSGRFVPPAWKCPFRP